MEKINIWEMGDKINVKINQEFLDFINKKIKEEFRTKRKVHKELIKYYKIPFSTFKERMKKSYGYFIDVEILLNICRILNILPRKLQGNIVAYRMRRGYNYIKNPKLPIKITPIFDMLVAHHMGDGNVVNPKKNRKPYFAYRQYNKEYRNLYIKKIESVFGNLKYKKDYFNGKYTTKIYFPVVCSYLMFRLYNLNINSFKSETARIPKEVFKKGWEHKLAFLIGLIIDEGCVDSNLIVVRMKNKKLIEDLGRICKDLNYITSIRKGKEGLFCLYILSKSLDKLYNDYMKLLNKYPETNLGYKEAEIKEFINRLNKPKIYIKGNKEVILKELSKGNLTVNELSKKLNMTRQGTRYLIDGLAKENKVEVKSIVKFGNYKYGLKV